MRDARRPISRVSLVSVPRPPSRSRVTSTGQSGASDTVSAVARARAVRCAADGQFISRLGTRCKREAQGLHTWHEKLLKADIACRASAGAVPLAERDSICADGTSRASMRHEHVGCTVVMRYQWQSPAL